LLDARAHAGAPGRGRAVLLFLYRLALLLGFFVWGDVPTLALLTGSAIVVASGLVLLWREAARKQAAKRAKGRIEA